MFVKICGITNEEDALLAVAMGADAVGFVFAPSPRQIAPQQAADIARRLPPEILTVGVFRDETRQRVVEIVHRSGLRAAQLHGHEPPADSHWIRQRMPLVIKAFAAGDPRLDEADEYGADAILIDVADARLGRGVRLVAGRRRARPAAGSSSPAGSPPTTWPTPSRAVRPWGVDVSTGVERAPGRKDARKVRRFIEAATAAAPPGAAGPGRPSSTARTTGCSTSA